MSKATAGNSNLNWIKKDSLLRDDKSSNLAHDDKRLFYLQNTVDERLGNGRLVGSYWDSVHDIDDENKNLTSSAAYTSSEKTIPANRDHTQNALSTLFSMDSYSKSGILPTQQRLAGTCPFYICVLSRVYYQLYRNNRNDSYCISSSRRCY
jgi:hypothetical protein